MNLKIDVIIKKAFYFLLGLILVGISAMYLFGVFDRLQFESHTLNMIKQVLYIIFRLNILWIAFVIFLENANPARTVTWLIVLALLPLIGFLLYLIFGANPMRKKKALRMENEHELRLSKIAEKQNQRLEHNEFDSKRLMSLLMKCAESPITYNNDVQVIASGVVKFEKLFEDIQQATSSIHMEYYIFKDDHLGWKLLKLLKQKASEGVEIRILFDDVGSLSLGKDFKHEMLHAGIEYYRFFKVLFPLLSRDLNYRNHRKIVVIDGTVAYLGGFNVGDEYLGKNKKIGNWRDTHLRIRGDAVSAVQNIFLDDWNFISKQQVKKDITVPTYVQKEDTAIQIVASGPDYKWKSMHQAFYKMISEANDKLWIATPYLVPDESLLTALKVAALSGVDVKIMIPMHRDHFFVYWSGQSNIEPLLEAGVKIYAYDNGFMHSKVVISDDVCATVGTANLDIRSMEINFEINAFIYDIAVIEILEKNYLEDLQYCFRYELDEFKKRGGWRKVLEAVGKIVSPIQ